MGAKCSYRGLECDPWDMWRDQNDFEDLDVYSLGDKCSYRGLECDP